MGESSRRKGERRAQAAEPRTSLAITDREREALAMFFGDHIPREATDRERRIALKRSLRIDDAHARTGKHPQTGRTIVALGLAGEGGKFEPLAKWDHVPRLHDVTRAQAEFLLEQIKKSQLPDDVEEILFELGESLRRIALGTYKAPANALPVDDDAQPLRTSDDDNDSGEGAHEP